MIINRTHGGNASGSIFRIAFGTTLLAIFLLMSSAGAALSNNIALNGTATASGYYAWASAESFPPEKVIDGNYDENVTSCDSSVFYNYSSPRTFWLLPDGQTGWVQVDLGTNHSIKKLTWLNTHNRACNDRATTKYHIAISQTGIFTDDAIQIINGTMSFSSTPTWQEYTLENAISARYVRFS